MFFGGGVSHDEVEAVIVFDNVGVLVLVEEVYFYGSVLEAQACVEFVVEEF